MPTLLWRDVTAVGVQCLVQGEQGNDAALAAELCERVRRMASRSAPVPVRLLTLGDPGLLAPRNAVLLVHGSVQRGARGRLLAFSVRPFRASADQASVLFGAAPRTAIIPTAGVASAALDRALSAALSEVLPWQHRPQGPRPIAGRP